MKNKKSETLTSISAKTVGRSPIEILGYVNKKSKTDVWAESKSGFVTSIHVNDIENFDLIKDEVKGLSYGV